MLRERASIVPGYGTRLEMPIAVLLGETESQEISDYVIFRYATRI